MQKELFSVKYLRNSLLYDIKYYNYYKSYNGQIIWNFKFWPWEEKSCKLVFQCNFEIIPWSTSIDWVRNKDLRFFCKLPVCKDYLYRLCQSTSSE